MNDLAIFAGIVTLGFIGQVYFNIQQVRWNKLQDKWNSKQVEFNQTIINNVR